MNKKIKATITTLSKGSHVIYILQTDGITQIALSRGWSVEQTEVRTREECQLFIDLLELADKEDR